MKKFIFMGLFVSLIFLFGFSASASVVTDNDELPDAGTTPESPLYGFDRFFERVSLLFTFSDEKRAEKLSKIADERLAELNELDPDAAAKYADELFNEYGLDLEKANIYVAKLVADGKITDEQLAKLEARLDKVEAHQAKVKAEVKEKISQEVREQVETAIQNARMSIFNRFVNLEQAKALHNQGFGYGQILKLQAIADLSGKTIDELIAIEGVVTTNENNEKDVNFNLLLTTLNITQEQLNEKLREYRVEAKEQVKEKLNEAKDNAEQRRDQIKDRIKNHRSTSSN